MSALHTDRTDSSGRLLPRQHCPFCRHEFTAASMMDGEEGRPSPSDLTLCIGCAAILTFDPAMNVRAAIETDMTGLTPEQHEQIKELQQRILLA